MATIKVKTCSDCPLLKVSIPEHNGDDGLTVNVTCTHPAVTEMKGATFVDVLSTTVDVDILSNVNFLLCPLKQDDVKVVKAIECQVPVVDMELIGVLCKNYPDDVSWGGENRTIKFSSPNTEEFDVIVFEKGIRGPADHFVYSPSKKLWAHGGYAGYKTTRTTMELINYINEMIKNNRKWE